MIGLLITLFAFYFFFDPSKRYISAFLIIALATAGFQMIPVFLMEFPAIGITKTYDWIYVFFILLVLFQPQVFLQFPLWKKYKNILIFLIVLIVLLFYSIFSVGVEVAVAIRVFRNFCFFFSLFLFIHLSKEDLNKVFRLIVYSISLASILYCFQSIIRVSLLNSFVTDTVMVTFDGVLPRYYNLPVLVLPILFFFFFSKGLVNIRFYPFLAIMNFMAIILSQHRSMLLALIVCFLLNLLLSNKIKLVTLLAYIVIAGTMLFFADNLLGGRFTSGFQDLSDASISVSKIQHVQSTDLPLLSTSEFRAYHFGERFLYVMEEKERALMGIGLITEDSKIANTLSFSVGTTDEDMDLVPQIATGDIVWSVLILNLGLVGITAFMIFYLGFFKRFISLRKDNMMKIGIYYIVFLFFTSVYGTSMMAPFTFCLLMLFAAYAYRLQLENAIDEGLDIENNELNFITA